MADNSVHIGDYTIQTTGSLNLASDGQRVMVSANGTEGSVAVYGQKAAGMFCAPGSIGIVGESDEAAKVGMSAGEGGEIELTVGVPYEGAIVTMMPESITMTVGVPGTGSMIEMTPESIIFKVAEVTFTMTAEGITEDVAEVSREMTAEGHNLTAAETEVNIGVSGETKELPMATAEVEATNSVNESIGDITADGMLTIEASMAMAE